MTLFRLKPAITLPLARHHQDGIGLGPVGQPHSRLAGHRFRKHSVNFPINNRRLSDKNGGTGMKKERTYN